ncbi:type VI secretion protein [Pseudomonas sp. NZIPFR-PS2]|nr:type VI secretion protein [Pseudomonas sp. NZIPFR-PS2]
MLVHNVIWQEGMLLRPQHLQHNDRYYHRQLNRTRLLSSDAWGFLTLDLDLQYLNLGKVVVNQASGVLPDGSLFELSGAMEPLVLQVPANAGRQAVYLALPLATENQVEVRRKEQSDVLARYVACETEIGDSNAGADSRCQINCARPDLRLMLGEGPSDAFYVKLQVAQVQDSTREDGVSLDADFVPTFIYLQGTGYVSSCIKEVISLLATRGDAIAARIQGSGASTGAQVGDFLMLQLINRAELILRHYLVQAQVRPERLYRELLSILGELSTFANDNKRAQLAEQQRQYGVLVCPVSDLKLLGTATFILAATAQCDSEELRHRLPAHLKIGPVERIRELVNLHLAGIKVQPLPVAPRQIPYHAAKTYFMLELSPRDIAQLEQSGGFAFHASGEFAELELNFWAIRN